MTELVTAATSRATSASLIGDLAALGKPRLSALVIFTAATGVWLSPIPSPPWATAWFLLATAALVAAANTLNCWLERDIDGLMSRTRRRPLPAGRLEPRTAFVFGIALGVVALAGIVMSSNGRTALLGAAALAIYVLIYTPLKRLSPWALVVGAVPGALPPLMGWTAATGGIAPPGWFLFGVLFLWQIPHFVAIALYLEDDFRRAGIRAVPVAYGRRAARAWLFAGVAALVAFSLLAIPIGIGGPIYTAIALVVGLAWLALASSGLRRDVPEDWARRLFGMSLLYLPLVITSLVLDTAW